MSGPRREVDLGRLAEAYHFRGERGAARRAAAAADAAALGPGSVALDVGGGTGAHAAVFAGRGARVVVVDRSPAMAGAARAGGVQAVLADGAALPFAPAVATLVYFHLAIHHGDPLRWLGEAARVVRPGGLVWVWTLAASHHRASFLAHWFPSVAVIDERRFPHPDSLARGLAALGFVEVTQGEEEERVERRAGEWREAVRSGFVSTLHLVDPAELEAGLAAFAAAHPNSDELIGYDLVYARVAGRRPSLPS